MKIQGEIENINDIEVTLSITMNMGEWKDLEKDLPERYPHWKLGSAITDAFLQLNRNVNEEIKID